MNDVDALARLRSLFGEKPDLLDGMKGITDPTAAAAKLAAIAEANGIALDAAELQAHFGQAIAQSQVSGALSDDALDGVAGGSAESISMSIQTLGLFCAIASVIVAASGGNCGEWLASD